MKTGNPGQFTSMQLVLSSSQDISRWEVLHNYNSRFTLYVNKQQFLFWDRFWPSCYLAQGFLDRKYLTQHQLLTWFIYGFVPAALEWKPNYIKNAKSYDAQVCFWQFPCRTEADGFERHRNLSVELSSINAQSIYIGLPWATWIDLKAMPANIIRAYDRRIASIKQILNTHAIALSVHTICQHIFWQRYLYVFEELGITDLWVSHKHRYTSDTKTMRIHSWALYPVNIRDPSRRQGLSFIPADQKPILASFRGAFMAHYISATRVRLQSLADKPGFIIELTSTWHFNPLVYNHQVLNQTLDSIQDFSFDNRRYNELLSMSVFSLCPAGAGPNTLRLWEALSIGSIPVVLSDDFQPPLLPPPGCTPWLFHPESEIAFLEQRLRSFSTDALLKMQRDALAYSELVESMVCF